MSSCSSCSTGPNYIAYLNQQATAPAAAQPIAPKLPAAIEGAQTLNTSGPTGRSLNITA